MSTDAVWPDREPAEEQALQVSGVWVVVGETDAEPCVPEATLSVAFGR